MYMQMYKLWCHGHNIANFDKKGKERMGKKIPGHLVGEKALKVVQMILEDYPQYHYEVRSARETSQCACFQRRTGGSPEESEESYPCHSERSEESFEGGKAV